MWQLFTDEEFQCLLDDIDRIDQKAKELYDSKEENNDQKISSLCRGI